MGQRWVLNLARPLGEPSQQPRPTTRATPIPLVSTETHAQPVHQPVHEPIRQPVHQPSVSGPARLIQGLLAGPASQIGGLRPTRPPQDPGSLQPITRANGVPLPTQENKGLQPSHPGRGGGGKPGGSGAARSVPIPTAPVSSALVPSAPTLAAAPRSRGVVRTEGVAGSAQDTGPDSQDSNWRAEDGVQTGSHALSSVQVQTGNHALSSLQAGTDPLFRRPPHAQPVDEASASQSVPQSNVPMASFGRPRTTQGGVISQPLPSQRPEGIASVAPPPATSTAKPVRAAPHVRVNVNFTVKIAVYCSRRLLAYGVFDCDFHFHSHE